MDLTTAKATPLMGRPESWRCNGGKPLGDLPDGLLKQARRFFTGVLQEEQQPNLKMELQLEAIALVLEDRAVNNPQTSLLEALG